MSFKKLHAPHENHDQFDVNAHEKMSFSWLRSLHACEAGSFTEYNLESIRVELTVLEGSCEHPGKCVEHPGNGVKQKVQHNIQV